MAIFDGSDPTSHPQTSAKVHGAQVKQNVLSLHRALLRSICAVEARKTLQAKAGRVLRAFEDVDTCNHPIAAPKQSACNILLGYENSHVEQKTLRSF